MSLHEIVLPETKPETEWILGRPVQKVSPRRTHAVLQSAIAEALHHWAGERGDVGTEWRFRIAPPGQIRRPLVPDVAFVSHERMRRLDDDEAELPPFAPDVAVEVLSPGDSTRRVDHKVEVYLAAGASLVVVVDPSRRTVRLHDAHGVRALHDDDVLRHPALPGFAMPLRSLFARAGRRR
jgi:Uma2 family endonuclease